MGRMKEIAADAVVVDQVRGLRENIDAPFMVLRDAVQAVKLYGRIRRLPLSREEALLLGELREAVATLDLDVVEAA